jgi:hypothetical protein
MFIKRGGDDGKVVKIFEADKLTGDQKKSVEEAVQDDKSITNTTAQEKKLRS